MKKRSSGVFLLSITTALLFSGLIFAADDDFPVRAPAAVKGTTEAMLAPSFWIGRIENPERELMTHKEIKTLNEINAARIIPEDNPYRKNIDKIEKDGPIFNVVDPLSVTIDMADVRKRLEINNERLLSGTFYDSWNLPLTDEKKAEMLDAVNMAALPQTLEPEYGVIVAHSTARLYPTAEAAYRMRGYLDDNSVSSLDIAMPVAVIHSSKSGDYCFVLSPIAWGWVPATDIAFGSAAKIRNYRDADDCIVSITHKTPYYADKGMKRYMGHLYLGERLKLDKKAGDMYRVTVPVRDADGSLEFKKGWAPVSDAVSEGYLPYTQENVITTAFQLLGRQYGWHDSWDERDCGGIMRVIFNCFGFTLPRYWSYEQLCSDRAAYVGDMEDLDRKSARLTTFPEGVTFTGSTGHIGLYLGSVDGIPYCIHQCGWNYKDGGKEYKMARTVVSDYINVGFRMKSIGYFSPMLP